MAESEEIYLPALKGRFGVRFYYVVLMTLAQVAKLIRIGDEIYSDKALSAMIQRELRAHRAKDIAAYLTGRDERFFNSMVVGVYGGAPDWEPFQITHGVSKIDASSLPLETINSFGFLKLTGNEKLFPLDGQHRLAGIREALKNDKKRKGDLAQEELSVIFVAHDAGTPTGRERSRRLFTVLNKKAKPVDQNEIIALDEDDIMAITCRWLVESYRPLMGGRIWYTASTNIPPTGKDCLTTIGTLYLVLQSLFLASSGRTAKELKDNRPTEEWLGFYFYVAKTFFDALAATIPVINGYVTKASFPQIASKQRHSDGGHLLFRPVGLRAFADVVAALVKRADIDKAETDKITPAAAKRRIGETIRAAVLRASKLPLDLQQLPYKDLLWDAERKRVEAGKRVLARDLMLDMLGEYARRDALRSRYAKALGKEGVAVRLPSEQLRARKN